MDKGVEHVERIFGLFFISSGPKHNRARGAGRLFGAAAAVKPALAVTTRPQNIRRYAP
jgi:hypothetical protein